MIENTDDCGKTNDGVVGRPSGLVGQYIEPNYINCIFVSGLYQDSKLGNLSLLKQTFCGIIFTGYL